MGCLLTLLLFSAVLYYGVNIGEVYYRFYQLQEEFRSQARLAPSLGDDVIRRRILIKIDQLGLPTEAGRFKIQRLPRPRQIVIEGEYREDVHLPLFNHTFVLKPRAVAPL